MSQQPFEQQLVTAHGHKVGRVWWITLGLIFVLGSGIAWLIGKLSGGGILGVVLWLGITISLGWLLLALLLRLGIHFEPSVEPLTPLPWRSVWIGWLLSLGYILVPLVTILMIGEIWGKEARLAAVVVFTLLYLRSPQLLGWLRRRRYLGRTSGDQ